MTNKRTDHSGKPLPWRLVLLCGGTLTLLGIAAAPAAADSNFERGFERELGRILAHEAVSAGKAVLYHGGVKHARHGSRHRYDKDRRHYRKYRRDRHYRSKGHHFRWDHDRRHPGFRGGYYVDHKRHHHKYRSHDRRYRNQRRDRYDDCDRY